MITVTDLDEVSENQNSDYLEVTYQQVEGKHWVYDKNYQLEPLAIKK